MYPDTPIAFWCLVSLKYHQTLVYQTAPFQARLGRIVQTTFGPGVSGLETELSIHPLYFLSFMRALPIASCKRRALPARD